jgi:hypothetical protein
MTAREFFPADINGMFTERSGGEVRRTGYITWLRGAISCPIKDTFGEKCTFFHDFFVFLFDRNLNG